MTSDSESRPSEPIAQVRDLDVSFDTAHGRVHALRGVSLDLRPGEVLALVGESGSGKSVLSSCLLGLPPESRRTTIGGSVTVAGADMLSGSGAQRRAVRRRLLGAVFQDPLTSLDPTMRIGSQLTERGVSAQRARRLLRGRDPPLTDARAPGDPLIVGVHETFEVGARHHPIGQIRAGSGDPSGLGHLRST